MILVKIQRTKENHNETLCKYVPVRCEKERTYTEHHVELLLDKKIFTNQIFFGFWSTGKTLLA